MSWTRYSVWREHGPKDGSQDVRLWQGPWLPSNPPGYADRLLEFWRRQSPFEISWHRRYLWHETASDDFTDTKGAVYEHFYP